jgi:hypothetical protein
MSSVLNTLRKAFTKIMGEAAESVVVHSVTWTRNTQDDSTKTTSPSTTTAKIERGGGVQGKEELQLEAGTLGDADLAMYFPHSYTTGLSVGNYVTYSSTNYKITKVKPYTIKDGALVYTKVFLEETNEVFS